MRLTELRNQAVNAGQVPIEMTGGEEFFFLTFTDRATGDVVSVNFPKAIRDDIVAKLNGSGLVVARDVPKMQ